MPGATKQQQHRALWLLDLRFLLLYNTGDLTIKIFTPLTYNMCRPKLISYCQHELCSLQQVPGGHPEFSEAVSCVVLWLETGHSLQGEGEGVTQFFTLCWEGVVGFALLKGICLFLFL